MIGELGSEFWNEPLLSINSLNIDKSVSLVDVKSRGLVQVWVTKVVFLVPLLEQQRLTTGRFNFIYFYHQSEPQSKGMGNCHRDSYQASLKTETERPWMALLKNSTVNFWPKSKLFTMFNKNATISMSIIKYPVAFCTPSKHSISFYPLSLKDS